MRVVEMTVECPECEQHVVLDGSQIAIVTDEADPDQVAANFICPACKAEVLDAVVCGEE